MTLFPCKDCGHNVSLSAKVCPSCGAESPLLERAICEICGGQVMHSAERLEIMKKDLGKFLCGFCIRSREWGPSKELIEIMKEKKEI